MKKRILLAVLVLVGIGLILYCGFQQDRKKQLILPEATNDYIFSWLW